MLSLKKCKQIVVRLPKPELETNSKCFFFNFLACEMMQLMYHRAIKEREKEKLSMEIFGFFKIWNGRELEKKERRKNLKLRFLKQWKSMRVEIWEQILKNIPRRKIKTCEKQILMGALVDVKEKWSQC